MSTMHESLWLRSANACTGGAANILLLLLVVVLLLVLLVLSWRQRKCWQLIWQLNGMRGLLLQPILWIFLLTQLKPNAILDVTCRLRKYLPRPLAIIVGTRVLLYVDDPFTMESILNAPECLDKTFMQQGFFASKGLLHAKGQKWKIRRKQLNPAFSHNILLNFFDVYNDVGNQLVSKFEEELQGDAVKFKDIEELLSRAVLEVSCLTTMGTATNFTQYDANGIARAYKKLMELSALRIIKPWLQIDAIFRLLDGKNYKSYIESNKLVEKFVNTIVERKHIEWKQQTNINAITNIATTTMTMRTTNMPLAANEENIIEHNAVDVAVAVDDDDVENKLLHILPAMQKRIFIEQIFHLTEKGEMTLQDVIDESHSMVLVSFETVSNSIIIALLCLAMHCECQHKLRHEINETFATNTDNGHNDVDNITAAHLQEMKYLDMIVSEALRILTTVPMNMRHVSKDFQLPLQQQTISEQVEEKESSTTCYVTVPKDTIIVLDAFNMQRDANYWGPYAQQFQPEQHFAAGMQQQRHAYAFIPFSKGLRWCIGSRYSMFLIKILLIKIISYFEFHTTTKLEQLRFIEGVSLKFKNSNSINFQVHKIKRNN